MGNYLTPAESPQCRLLPSSFWRPLDVYAFHRVVESRLDNRYLVSEHCVGKQSGVCYRSGIQNDLPKGASR
jgi:hypothetical protein